MYYYIMSFSEILKIGCIKQHITVSELAEKIGSSKQNLANKITRDDFKESDINKICEALEIEHKFFDKSGKEL